MKKLHLLLVFCIALLAVQCEQPAPASETPAVDVAAEEQALMQADQRWSDASATYEGHMSYFADDAIVFATNKPMISGKENISKDAAEMFNLPGASVKWSPTSVEVAASGDIGYSYGNYTFSMIDSTGNTITDNGKYLTVWEKQADGSWKVVADAYNTDMPMQE